MMTSCISLFRRWGDVLSPHRKIDSAMLLGSRDAVKRRSLSPKPLSQIATVVLQNCDDEVTNHYPISTYRRFSRRHKSHSQHSPWNGAGAFSVTSAVEFHDSIKKSFSALALKRGMCFLCNQCPESGRRSERWTIRSPLVYPETRYAKAAQKQSILWNNRTDILQNNWNAISPMAPRNRESQLTMKP